jgi:hypothetical protein
MAENITLLCNSGKIYQYNFDSYLFDERVSGVTDDIAGIASIPPPGWDYRLDPSTFFATGRGPWVLRSVDNGVTWEKLDLILNYHQPRASFSYRVEGLTIIFTDTSTYIPTSWDWDFGDGSLHSTEQNPTHVYTSANIYKVTLTASNAAGSNMYTRYNILSEGVLFTRPNNHPEITDNISDSIHIKRDNYNGIYNSITEPYYSYASPENTEWSNIFESQVEDPTILTYYNWVIAVDSHPPAMVNKVIYMHIISEDRYFEIHFTQWTAGGGGGFSYTRYECTPIG